ncbi:MAG: TauD/TfdA family dioxygenase [Pseudomonadota bacterium]|nr:TauD/TfdA family dioxygenase [Pseudomonadota bacterium]
MDKKSIEFAPISGALGAIVSGVNFTSDLSKENLKLLQEGWLKYQVLIFEDQTLTNDQFKSAVRNFGEIEIHSFIGKIEDDDEIESLGKIKSSGWAPPTNIYHIDVSMQEVPTKGAALYAVDPPQVGGDTIWVNTYAAWDALSEPMQQFLLDRKGLFIAAHRNALDKMIRGGQKTHQVATGFLQDPSEHPLVHTHPETGRKALFVDELFMWSIQGLNYDENEAICSFLFKHISKPEFQFRYKWRVGSLAIWDNRCTMHRRVDDTNSKRIMHRLPIRGETSPKI